MSWWVDQLTRKINAWLRFAGMGNIRGREEVFLNAKAAGMLAFMVFPGYFFYHISKQFFVIPYVGWFSIWLALAAVYFCGSCFFSFSRVGEIKAAELFLCVPFLALVLYIALNVIINHVFNKAGYVAEKGLLWNVSIAVWMVGLFFVGRNMGFSLSPLMKLGLLFIMVAYFVFSVIFHDGSMQRMSMPLVGDAPVANYQGMARSVLYTSLFLLALLRGVKLGVCLILLSLVTLFLIGARAELYMMVLVVVAWILLNLRISIILISLVVASSVLIGIAINMDEVVGRFIPFGAEDASMNERRELFLLGINGIYKNPVFGDYLGQVRDFGGVGFYIHNVLSMWQQHGVFSFLIYIYLILLSFYVAVKAVVSDRKDVRAVFLIYISMTSLVGVLFTKAISWPIPALAWGLAYQVLASNRSPASRNVI